MTDRLYSILAYIKREAFIYLQVGIFYLWDNYC